jgi:putative inorganic carbon (HCO3(-)) transporter
MHRRQKVFFPPGHWFAIGFLAWAALSLAKAPVFLYGIFDLLRTFKFYLLYLFIANNIRSRGELRVLANALLFGVIVQGVICVYQYLAQDVSHVFGNLFGQQDMYSEETVKAFKSFFTVAPGTDLKRASGTVGPINAEAQYFEFLLPAAFVLWATAGRFLRRAFRFAALAAGLVGLVVTFSRGGLIGVTVGLAVALFLSRRYGLISSGKFAAYVVAALMAAVLLTPKFYQYTMTRPEAALARFHLNKVGLDMIKSHPLLGVGLNNHIVVKPEYDPESYMFPTPTHNHYLVVASEVGVPGLVLFSGFIVVCFLSALKAGRAIAPLEAAVGVGIAGAIAAISVHNLVDHLSYHTNLTMLWLLAGLAPALVRADGLAGAPAEAP